VAVAGFAAGGAGLAARGLIAALAGLVAGGLLQRVARHRLGGMTGDVFGAILQVSAAATAVCCALMS
jgi:adenosylcobinamide-GDP ribazoletransferase